MFASAPMQLATLYTLLAVVATAVNLAGQALSIAIYQGPYAVPVSVFVGTGVGLTLKYVMDKRYIFRFQARNLRQDTQLFALYTMMGLLTTFIFWGVEWSFYAIFGSAQMRYVGGMCGLAIGYLLKYRLDKRYVFAVERAQ